jgi:multicomponent Na+:H+ antiporter subunit G
MSVADAFTIIFISAGMFFFVAGTVGLLRFPDVFSRLHALTKADNLGLGLIVLGLLPQVGSVFVAVQAVLTWVLVMIAGAVGSYLIANHALHLGAANSRQPTSGHKGGEADA